MTAVKLHRMILLSNLRCMKYMSTSVAFSDAINRAAVTLSAPRLIRVMETVAQVRISRQIRIKKCNPYGVIWVLCSVMAAGING